MSAELVMLNVNELKNKTLKTQLNKINTAIVSGKKSQWNIAEAICKIMTDSLYVDDFENEKEFADYMGMSRPNLNKLKRCVEYRDTLELNDYSTSKVMEFLPLTVEQTKDLIEKNCITSNDTVSDIRYLVKDYRLINGLIEEKAENVSCETSETEEVEETEETETEVTTEEDYIEVSIPLLAIVNNKVSYENITIPKGVFYKLIDAIESVLS